MRRALALEYEEIGPATQRSLGVAGAIVIVVALLACAALYVLPVGKHTYRAELTEAGSVRVGDDVRIAGIRVGSVRSLELTDDSVRMEFDAKRSVVLGDQTSAEVRMLTPIGGHYIALFPAGRARLSAPIPASRVRLPYSLIEVFTDAQRPLAGLDGTSVQQNLGSLTKALDKRPDAIRELTEGMATMVGLIDRQNDDVQRAFGVAQEYVRVLSDTRGMIGEMLGKIGLMEEQILNRRAEVVEALTVATQLLARIAAVEPSWRFLEPMVDEVFKLEPQIRTLLGRLDKMLGTLRAAGEGLQQLLGPDGLKVDQSRTTVELSTCVPVPGRRC